MKSFAYMFIGTATVCVGVIALAVLLLGPIALGLTVAGALGGVIGGVVGIALSAATLNAALERWS